jgi:hypothetical protein
MVSKDLRIEIRPIPNRNNIKQFSENLEYFSQSHTISAFVDPVTGKFATGLSEEDKEYLQKEGFPYDFNDKYTRGVPHPFWESSMAKVELRNSPFFLYPGKNLLDFVKYKYLLVSNYIYKSEEELKIGSKTQATHYIFNEGEETVLKASAIETRNNLIRKVGELSLNRKKELVQILLNETTDNKNEDYLTVRLDAIIEDKDLSKELKVLLENSTQDITLVAEIKSAILKGVLKKTKKGIFFFDTNLGFQEEDVKEFLILPENQEIYLNIKSKIE